MATASAANLTIPAQDGDQVPTDVLAVMDAVELERTDVMGYSMGRPGWSMRRVQTAIIEALEVAVQ